MNIKAVGIGAVILLALGFLGGRYVAPPKEVIKTEVQEKEVIKKDVVTVTKVITRPDGTKEEVTTTTDKSQERKNKTTEILAKTGAEKQWHISAGLERASLTSANIYSLQVERRILGPFSAGLRANSERTLGVVIGAEF